MNILTENLKNVSAVFHELSETRILQPIWDLRLGYEHYLSSPLFPVIVSVTFYFALVTIFAILDLTCQHSKWLGRYKIQPQREVKWSDIRKAIILTFWNHLLYILPFSIGQWIYTPASELPEEAPPLFEFCWQHIASLAIFDLEYFILHSAFHKIRFLYRHIHAVHHEYSSPNSWTTEYLHPWELISVGIFSTTAPWILKAHPLTCWSFELFAIAVSVDNHVGYDFPLFPHHWFPFWAGSIKHDMHHQRPLTNFQPFFTHWDRLFGTECPGQRAGGYKPPKLIEWEDKFRSSKMATLKEDEDKQD